MANNGSTPIIILAGLAVADVAAWWFTRPSGRPSPCPPLGDLNGDGKINQADIDLLATVMGQFVDPNNPISVRADVNGDGIVNISYFSILAGYINGDINTFPGCV